MDPKAPNPWTNFPPPLGPDEVHIWHGSLVGKHPSAWLSPDEIARRDRFKLPHLRTRFAAARGHLRMLAAAYRGCPPETLQFTYGEQGKPALEGLHFNISHTGDHFAAAFAAHGPVGLDIEEISDRLHARAIARRYFCASEIAQLDTPDDPEYLRRFHRLWTAKEAVMKATALGFALELSKIEIQLHPLRLVRLTWNGPQAWDLVDVAPQPSVAGTLACRPGSTVRVFPIPPADNG